MGSELWVSFPYLSNGDNEFLPPNVVWEPDKEHVRCFTCDLAQLRVHSDSWYHHPHHTAALRAGMAALKHPSKADTDGTGVRAQRLIWQGSPQALPGQKPWPWEKVAVCLLILSADKQSTAACWVLSGTQTCKKVAAGPEGLPVHLGSSRCGCEAFWTLSRPQGPCV